MLYIYIYIYIYNFISPIYFHSSTTLSYFQHFVFVGCLCHIFYGQVNHEVYVYVLHFKTNRKMVRK